MARRQGDVASRIYSAAAVFREEALSRDGSLFRPGAAIWTPATIDDLHKRFVLRPDESKDKDFETKLRGQLADAPAATIQLTAEMVFVHLLISTQLKGDTKRALIETILSWAPERITIPQTLAAALDGGLCNAGQGFLRYRYAILSYLIAFARGWKDLSAEEGSQTLGDAWAFKRFVFSIPAAKARAQQFALMHLVHPDTFEAIVSEKHRSQIIHAFLPADRPTETDIDEELRQVRALLSPRYGDSFSFYEVDLKSRWHRTEDEAAFTSADFKLFQRYRNSVNYGRIPAEDKAAFDDLRKRVRQVLDSAVSDIPATAAWKTHLSIKNPNGNTPKDYWCALYPPDAHNKSYAVQIAFIISERGVEICFCLGSGDAQLSDSEERQKNEAYFTGIRERLQELGSGVLSPLAQSLDSQWHYRRKWRSDPGVSDFGTLTEWRDFAAAIGGEGASISRYLSPADVVEAGDGISEHYHAAVTTFMFLFEALKTPGSTAGPPQPPVVGLPPQSGREAKPYSREDALAALFVSDVRFDEMLTALREKKNLILLGAPGVGKTFVAKRLAQAFVGAIDPQRIQTIQFHQSYSYEDFIQGLRPARQGGFVVKKGLFFEFCRRAQTDEGTGRPYVFMIDEINRGNLSKIFGELMMLLEPDKRGREFAMPLTYSETADETFYVPTNLYVIGMMNTADRSLAMVDHALRRRFRFIRLHPEFGSVRFSQSLMDAGAAPDLVGKIVQRMSVLNEAIVTDTKNLGPGFEIGHSFFCPQDGISLDEQWYERIIETEIVPLLEEYWFGHDQRVNEHRDKLLA